MSVENTRTGNVGKRKVLHGGYTACLGIKERSSRAKVFTYLNSLRTGLVQELGATHYDQLTASQQLCIDRITANISLLRSMEENARLNKRPVTDNVLKYDSQVSRYLKLLNLDKKRRDKPFDHKEWLKSMDKRGK